MVLENYKAGDEFTISRRLGNFHLRVENVTDKRIVFRFDGERSLSFGPKRFAKMIAK